MNVIADNLAASTKTGPYDRANLRFRKAYIRERLAALKSERDALLAERARIDDALGMYKPNESVAARAKGFG